MALSSALHTKLSVLFVHSSETAGREDMESPERAAFIAGTVGSAVEVSRVPRHGQPVEEIALNGHRYAVAASEKPATEIITGAALNVTRARGPTRLRNGLPR